MFFLDNAWCPPRALEGGINQLVSDNQLAEGVGAKKAVFGA
jgi:hypothetical protein